MFSLSITLQTSLSNGEEYVFAIVYTPLQMLKKLAFFYPTTIIVAYRYFSIS